MKTKFDWRETLSCPTGYPVEIYSGGLISQDGKYTSLLLGLHNGPWGSSGRSMRGSVKQILTAFKLCGYLMQKTVCMR